MTEAFVPDRRAVAENEEVIVFDDRLKETTDLKSENKTLRVERFALAQALEELCELKIIKDRDGKTDEYLKRQPEAWVAAFQVITTLEI